MTVRHALLAILVATAVATSAFAQTPLSGRVLDSQGGPVNDAVVTATASDGSMTRSTRTGPDGTFAIADATASAYSLQVEAPGFERSVQDVTAGTAAITVTLQIAGFAETVAVAAPKLEEELPQELERTGARVQTITGAQIENGGYYDVAQALQALVPGLFLSPRAGAFDYVTASLQGSRTNEILWLVDGVRISNRLYNGVTPLDTLPAHMIDRIEVIEGGQGLFYGTSAVAGVINIVTKAFTDDGSGRLQSGLDTNKGGHVNLFARDTRNGHRFVLYGSKDQADGYRPFPEGELQPSSTDRRRSYDVLTMGGKYAFDFSPAVRFSAMYQRSDVTLDQLRAGRSSASQTGGLAGAFNDRTEHVLSTKIDFSPRPTFDLFLKQYYHQWDSRWSETHNVIGAPGTERVISDREFWGYKDYGANVLARMAPTGGVEYFAGYDFQNYSGRDDVLLIAQNTETVHAVFGQVRTTRDLFDRGTIAAGVRYNAPTNSKQGAVWNVTGRYDISASTFTRGVVGTAFRYPDAYELFAVDPTCCFGNPNLKPERSTNFNGSIGHRFVTGATALTLEAIGFYRRVSDLIVDVDDGSGETTITANRPDQVRVRGVTLVGSVDASSSISGSLGYTYTRSQRSNELAGGYSALAGIPSNQVDASIDFHPTRLPFGATLTMNGVGEMFDTVSGFGSVESGEYRILDLAGRFFFDSRRRHRINLRLENLFDNRYTTIHSRAFLDASATPFVVHNLGTPRTLHVSYSFSY
jgi:outer membrane cobalamin receptor